jgi:uncharacterized protein (TIGR00730 family)
MNRHSSGRDLRMMKVCVYCGSSAGSNGVYRETARKLGSALASRNLELVYGGAEVGLMGEVADTVMRAGGRAIGIIPKAIASRVSHRGLSELHIVSSMHERKQMMVELSDAFIALPGGFGTLEEIAEALTWAQLGFHKKPCGLINVSGYFDPLLSFLDRAVSEGFMKPEHRRMLLVSDDPAALLESFKFYAAPRADKWINAPARK